MARARFEQAVDLADNKSIAELAEWFAAQPDCAETDIMRGRVWDVLRRRKRGEKVQR